MRAAQPAECECAQSQCRKPVGERYAGRLKLRTPERRIAPRYHSPPVPVNSEPSQRGLGGDIDRRVARRNAANPAPCAVFGAIAVESLDCFLVRLVERAGIADAYAAAGGADGPNLPKEHVG